ncbi:MAG: class I SAM-dependent methyltransferase [Acidimicrobiales bacterium]
MRTALGRPELPPLGGTSVDPEELRPVYEELLAGGTGRFFEARRPDCPLCGSTELQGKIRTPDLLQHKPGEFVLVECGGCGHIFQNPRLSLEGLAFYYRDFYDGLGEEQLEFVFGASDTAYRGRAGMLDGRRSPRAWLDVGAGHGHFCLVAGEHWPDTRFDGLDMSDSIEEAERRGWVAKGFRGMFPELAPDLAGVYDVVSMHHYPEHIREPKEELDAARRVLRPGGYLLIELPDPESVYGRVLGKYWVPWFQPQHQHLLSLRNLEAVLTTMGMTVEVTERGVASQPVDLLFAVWFLVNRLAPAPDLPWRRPSGWYDRLWRNAVLVAAVPAFVLAFVADQVLALVIRRRRRSNTYRVLARLGDGG